VNNFFKYRPALLRGLIVQGVAIFILVVVSLWGFWQLTRAQVGPVFLIYLLLFLLGFSLVTALVYCAYALWQAEYTLEREGLHLKWGLRMEDIPMASVDWVRTKADLGYKPPLPWLRLPGAVLGVRRLPDGKHLEYFAAETHHLVFIAAQDQVFAITPENPKHFLETFGQLMEMGTLTHQPIRSVYPGLLIRRVWLDHIGRYLILGGLFFSFILLVSVSFVIPTTDTISLRFDVTGAPLEQIPSVQLMLFPVLNTAFFIVDFLLGLFLYRNYEDRQLAYLLWGSSVLTGILFVGALLFITQAG
jgi:hypothetical protein